MTLEEIIKLRDNNETEIVLQTDDYVLFEYGWCEYGWIVKEKDFGIFKHDIKDIAKLIALDVINYYLKQYEKGNDGDKNS